MKKNLQTIRRPDLAGEKTQNLFIELQLTKSV